MANEVKAWRAPGCDLGVEAGSVSSRETFSREVNEHYGEGGALNANYRTMEAGMIVSNILGKHGLEYNKDFILKTAGDMISLDFCTKKTKSQAAEILMFHGYTVHT